MPLISDEYLDLNQKLHKELMGYGYGGWRWVGVALCIAEDYGCKDVLDYGCGKGSFSKWFPKKITRMEVTDYDPATAKTDPKPRDLVMCIDVMEHIEPDCLDDVLKHLDSKIKRVGLFLISTREAGKHLADGRNAHLIIQSPDWWEAKFREVWPTVVDLRTSYPELVKADEVMLLVEKAV